MADSRLARRRVNQSKNQLYGSIFAIIAVLFIALTFGPFLIGAAGNLIDKITGKTGDAEIVKTDADIQPPVLDPLPNATPSAQISISGKTDYRQGEVQLYVNNSLSDTTDIDNSQRFEFTGVQLKSGANTIRARVVLDDKKGAFSNEEFINYSKSEPKLEVSNPQDKQEFHKADKQITVRGTTDADNSISVNGFVAIVDNSGNFSYDLNLNDGENKISIVATAPSGQTKTSELTVNYSE